MMTRQSSSMEFPAFCVAAPAAARRRLAALASAWAARYKKSRDFPELETVPVEDGSLVFTESTFDLGGQPGVRIYLVHELLDAVQKALGWANATEVAAAFEAAIRRLCWGALALVIVRRPDTVDSLRARIDALLPCWPALDQFQYVDAPGEPTMLAGLVETRFGGLLGMWRRQTTGDAARDLLAALEALEAADPASRMAAAAARLTHLAGTSSRVRHKHELGDGAILRRRLAELEPEEREAIETGSDTQALTLLYAIDRELA